MSETLVKLLDVILHDDSALRSWLAELKAKYESAVECPLSLSSHIKQVPFQQMLALLQARLASHDYRSASRLLESLAAEPFRARDAVFRAGYEVMFNLEHDSAGALDQLVGQLKQLWNTYNCKLVTLDYVFFLLLNDFRLHDALDVLAMEPHTRSMHRRALDSQTAEQINIMYTAYSGLVWYLDWMADLHDQGCGSRSSAPSTEPSYGSLTGDAAAMLSASQVRSLSTQLQSKAKADRAIASFNRALQTKGIWDIFLTKQVELFEYYDRTDDAYDLLDRYRTWCCPNNPNAHRYMYEFVKKHEDPTDILAASRKIALLEELQKLVPSHELVLTYCQLVRESDFDGRMERCLSALMAMLDYPCWQQDLRPWTAAAELVLQNRSSASFMRQLGTEWSDRCHWWSRFHFGNVGLSPTVSNVTSVSDGSDITSNSPRPMQSSPAFDSAIVELLYAKCIMSFHLIGPDNEYIRRVTAALPDVGQRLAVLSALPCQVALSSEANDRTSGVTPNVSCLLSHDS